MFARARRRLALRYLLVLAGVLGAFSLVFLGGGARGGGSGSRRNGDRRSRPPSSSGLPVALALIVADGAVVVLVGGAAYLLADRTLRPIQEAHERQRRFVADASHEMRRRSPRSGRPPNRPWRSRSIRPVRRRPSGRSSGLGALTELTDDLLSSPGASVERSSVTPSGSTCRW